MYVLIFAALNFQVKTPAEVLAPKRVIEIRNVECKVTRVGPGNPSGLTVFGGSAGVQGSMGATSSSTLDIQDPTAYAAGVAEVMVTEFSNSGGFIVLDVAPPGQSGNSVAQTEPPLVKPQYWVRAAVTELTVRSTGGGLKIGGLGASRDNFINKVVMDVRLIDPSTSAVIESVKASGQKGSKANFLHALAKDGSGQEIPVLGVQDIEGSPLGEASRLAIRDAIKQLTAKLAKHPWTATMTMPVTEDSKLVCYLTVGPECGLKVGTILEAFTPGQEVKDPDTGRILGRTKPTVHGLVRVWSTDGDLVSVETVGGWEMKPGMLVRLVSSKR